MQEQFSRTERLIGSEALANIQNSRVAVFGLGGVGAFVVEALARAGVSELDLVDSDTVSVSNLNRQLLALHSTVGKYKTDVAESRVLDINPNCRVRKYTLFYGPDTAGQFDFSQFDYVVDAIDTVTGKLALILQAKTADTPVISCMGAGNKLEASGFVAEDIYNTQVCPLARIMRKELKKRGVEHLKVVYSREFPLEPPPLTEEEKAAENTVRRSTPGSMPYVPGAAGLVLAGEVLKELAEGKGRNHHQI